MMNPTKPWVTGLNIKPSEYAEWLQAAPKGHSLTYWCLQQNKLSGPEYLSWAKNHYELIAITSDFFKKAPNIQFWNMIKTVANWSEEMVPLTEWDGVVYIACVEPNTETKWSFPIQFVLADARDLKSYWQKLGHQTEAVIAEKTFFGIPPTPDIQIASAPTVSDAPEGLNLFTPPATPVAATVPDGPEALDLPDGLGDLAISQVNINLPPTPDMLIFDPPADDTPILAEEPAPVISQVTPPKTADNPKYNDFLKLVKKDFLGGMLIEVQNKTLKALAWDENFKNHVGASEKTWTLDSPSAFRIVYRTKMPYLGHIVETDVNKDFFVAWGFKTFPKKVLIQPIKQDNEVTMLLLALADDSKLNHQLLAAGEKIIESLSNYASAA